MNSYEIGVAIIAVVAVAIQLGLLWQSKRDHQQLRDLIPSPSKLSVRRVFIPQEVIHSIEVSDILARLPEFSKSPQDKITEKQFLQYTTPDTPKPISPEMVDEGTYEIKLIQPHTVLTKKSQDLVYAVNTYLLRNKGTTGDFRAIQDMIDRSVDEGEHTVQQSHILALYVGIISCLVNILILVWPISSFLATLPFIAAFKIAAVPLVFGILVYGLASNLWTRDTYTAVGAGRLSFLNFLQGEMNTQLSHNITSAIFSMEKHLSRFNQVFQQQTQDYFSTLSGIRNTFQEQAQLVHELRNTDVVQLTELNATVLKELRNSTESFEKFNQYLHQMNAFVAHMDRLNSNMEQQFTQTAFMENMGKAIAAQTETNQKILTLLQEDMHQIDARKQYMADAIINIDEALQKSLDELKQHTEDKLSHIRQMHIDNEDWIGLHRLTDSIDSLREILREPKRKTKTEKKDA